MRTVNLEMTTIRNDGWVYGSIRRPLATTVLAATAVLAATGVLVATVVLTATTVLAADIQLQKVLAAKFLLGQRCSLLRLPASTKLPVKSGCQPNIDAGLLGC